MKPTIKITVLVLLAVATLAGCSKHDDDKILDTGRGEIRLSTATQAHQTRAYLFNPDVQIAASQHVGLHITKADGSPLYTNYNYTADGIGGLALPSEVSTPYYPADGGNVKISAYHPHASNSSAYDFVVADNQSSDAAYYGSDLLFSAPKEYRRQTSAHQLTFKHVLSKATYTLVAGAGSPDLTGATVEFLDLERAVSFNPTTGAVTTATTSIKSNITPHATYGAIVVPQTVVAGKNLIKVTLSDGTVLYHKAPAGGQTFAKGVKYHFTITVKYNELAMMVQTAPWEPVGNVNGNAELGGESGGLPLDQAQVGDFYCIDEDFGDYILPKDATLSDAQKAACVGIVFWKGDPANTTNGDPLLKRDFPGCTHGLVVALHEAKQPSASAAARMSWSIGEEQVNSWTNHIDRGGNKVNITEENKLQGYANTVALKAYTAQQNNANLKVLPIAAIEQYNKDYPAPSNSSGWYVPSIMELKYMCWGQGNSQSTAGRDLLNRQFDKAGGTRFDYLWSYWSSSEDADNSSGAWCMDIGFGNVSYSAKNSNRWVRALFAF